jgi:hypothetical protein
MIEAQTKVVEAARSLHEAVRMMAGFGSFGTSYAGYRRALKTLVVAQRALSGAMRRLETLEDAEEAVRTHEAGTEKLERGEGGLSS